MHKLTINTTKPKEVIDLTKVINDHLIKSGFEKGICNLFVSHTTCSLATANLDPGTADDYLQAFAAMVPQLAYHHEHDPSHVSDHIMSTVVGTSLTVPVESASMILGQWQRVVLIEFAGPKERRLHLTFIPDSIQR